MEESHFSTVNLYVYYTVAPVFCSLFESLQHLFLMACKRFAPFLLLEMSMSTSISSPLLSHSLKLPLSTSCQATAGGSRTNGTFCKLQLSVSGFSAHPSTHIISGICGSVVCAYAELREEMLNHFKKRGCTCQSSSAGVSLEKGGLWRLPRLLHVLHQSLQSRPAAGPATFHLQ